jgi:AcrR family transcriptional regulator
MESLKGRPVNSKPPPELRLDAGRRPPDKGTMPASLPADSSRRAMLVTGLADHVLAHGLATASLRSLAQAANTSDRMLLYYFTDKADLLAAILAEIAARLTRQLQAITSPGPLPPEPLRQRLTQRLLAPDLWPYMKLWLEIAAGAAAGDPLLRSVGEELARGFLAWGAAQLALPPEADRATEAARLLIAVEGSVLLSALGLGEDVALTLKQAD